MRGVAITTKAAAVVIMDMHHGDFPSARRLFKSMEDYLKQLQAEAKGVEEHLTEMKKGG